ncbi:MULTISPECIES: hypothetical protein [unclassified Carboxylicivirga]|uniref:hypothetical protein n=1 Tax=Carboxylicivirga TaxID=1628153 RepID=UPI003D34D324
MSEHFLKVKEYLLDLEYQIVKEDPAEELFVIEKEEEGISNLVIDCEDSIIIIEGFLIDLAQGSAEIYESLLKKNREIVHGALVLDESGRKVIFRDTLQLETLDINELEASINSLKLLMSEYSNELIEFSKA